MLTKITQLLDFKIFTSESELGRVSDLLFDERMWTTRYLVVDTTHIWQDRLILIAPAAVQKIDYEQETILLGLTQAQVEKSPLLEQNLPVSRQKEMAVLKYYGWPDYWQPLGVNIPESAVMFSRMFALKKFQPELNRDSDYNPYLRSANEIVNYRVYAEQKKAGIIKDYILQDVGWIFKYLVIRTGIFGKKILIAPSWIEKIDWATERVRLSLAQRLIKQAPKFSNVMSEAQINENEKI
jgi:hypothetical protein